LAVPRTRRSRKIQNVVKRKSAGNKIGHVVDFRNKKLAGRVKLKSQKILISYFFCSMIMILYRVRRNDLPDCIVIVAGYHSTCESEPRIGRRQADPHDCLISSFSNHPVSLSSRACARKQKRTYGIRNRL
jgi:hypothetical protein